MRAPDMDDKEALIHVLHMAYSGEKAAGYAYNAHWKSVRDPCDKAGIQKIESEEWEHREIVGKMLSFLSARPQKWRELMMATIGRTVGASCFLIGWFMPMYFAGRLEHSNVREYDVAAVHADALGLTDFAAELRRLSIVEAGHEMFFFEKVQGHPMLRLFSSVFHWGKERPETLPNTVADSPSLT